MRMHSPDALAAGNDAVLPMRKFVAFIWKTAVGVTFCLTPLTAILVLGWTGRAMRRKAVKTWYRQSQSTDGASFSRAMSADRETEHLAKWPNWVLSQCFRGDLSGAFGSGNTLAARARFLVRAFAGSLWENFTLGFQLAINCWVLTVPACLLWLLGWWSGWENSFNKGYEQAWVGPVTALAGVAIFVVAMFHLPLAQARQAVTGRWRTFYDFGISHRLRRLGRASALWLVVLYLVAGIFVTGAKIAPLAIGNLIDGSNLQFSAGNADLIKVGWAYAAATLVFVLFVGLRLIAAKQYARSITAGVASGRLDPAELQAAEQRYLRHFDLNRTVEPPERNLLVRSVAWSGAGIGAFVVLTLTAGGWALFSFQVFFGQFLNHSWVAWLNLSLIQLPWLR